MSREYVLHPFRAPVELQIDYARELNEQQHAAVTAPPGPSLVIAGAGSGKTRTLIYRVAYLLEQGIPPERMLLLTFTNKAAREMMRRVSDLLGHELAALWGGTFHSIGNRILRLHAPLLNFQRDFSILDREDARHLLQACIAESDIDTKATRFPKADVVADLISMASNTHKSIAAILAEDYSFFAELAPQISALRDAYVERKRSTNAMDFDDLLVMWLKLMTDHQEVRETYQRRFQFILVDEYQDTNKLQSDLIDSLAARHHNLMVVGDDAQSIYAWRGANYQNIIQFPNRYPETKIYKIETNYRSTPEILGVANSAIKANTQQFSKVLAAARKSGVKPVLVPCTTSSEQAVFVAQRALELREEGSALENMAVLYRSHFHALELQLELTRRNIPFSITSGVRFFEQTHVKDVTAYLKLVTNPRDELSFKRLVQLLPGIGGKGADKLWRTFRTEMEKIDQANHLDSAAGSPADSAPKSHGIGVATPIAWGLQRSLPAVPKKAVVSWAEFSTTTSQLEPREVRQSASKMIQLVLEASYEEHLKENYANYMSRLEDLKQLASFAQQFESIEEFLTQLALLTNIEADEEQVATRDDERLRLSTIHQAKGLEFDVVFVIMLCDGLFPSERSMESPDGLEEERRLFYVAITRARNELYFSYPLVRTMPGGGDFMQVPSRFLEEIPKDSLDEWNLRVYG